MPVGDAEMRELKCRLATVGTIGRCNGGKYMTNFQGWKMQNWKMRETTLYDTPRIIYVCSIMQDAIMRPLNRFKRG